MRNPIVERWNFLTFEQKLSVGILSVCGLIAVALSAYRIQQSVRAPFLVDRKTALAFKQSLTPTDAEEEARLKRTDTDGDGLSDWDETNVYKTNPNLKDTCGDGVTDNVRVRSGWNGKCTGKETNVPGEIDVSGVSLSTTTLYGGVPAAIAPDAMYANMAQAASQARGGTGSGAAATSSAADVGLPRDATLIRAALKGKVDQARLDALTDADLLSLYDKALAAQNGATPPVTP